MNPQDDPMAFMAHLTSPGRVAILRQCSDWTAERSRLEAVLEPLSVQPMSIMLGRESGLPDGVWEFIIRSPDAAVLAAARLFDQC